MNAQELRKQTKEELQDLLKEKKARLCQVRFSVKSRQARNHQEQNHIKKDVARILTVLKEKEVSN
ncbi:MAG: 50S ribosomal protein L29 [Candidatus Moranbacteria bacterium]|nr:50S ribosomal protein L29 [Candidatus Moranbacteria bacterium]